MSKIKSARNQRDAAQAKLDALTVQCEAKALERSLALLESPQPVQVPWSECPAYDQWGMGPVGFRPPYYWTSPDDYSEGRCRPLYENAQDVRAMRAQARRLVELFPVAKGALNKLTNYILGTGWDFLVKPKKRFKNDANAIRLASALQQGVDAFLEYNEFIGKLDREIHVSSRVDGDAFPTLYLEDQQVRLVLNDPGCLAEPRSTEELQRWLRIGHKLNGWWHGVHTVYSPQLKRDDVDRPLGYHFVYDRIGASWDYIPAMRVEHIKRNVPGAARVGVHDFVSVLDDLENEAKIRRNTAIGAAILAAIVMIRQHAEGASKSSIERMVSESATSTYQRSVQGGTRTMNLENAAPGTIKDTPAGMTSTVGPLGVLRSPVYIEVAQYLTRVIGAPWSMPEYLISGDASNGNYASSLVSEAPFVKYCEHEQAFYASHFVSLIWKATAILCRNGRLAGCDFNALRHYLQIDGEYQSPASRDAQQQLEVNRGLHDLGVMSKRSLAADHGLDFDEEIANGAKEKVEPAPMGLGSPFGGPPQPPQLEALAERALGRLLEARGA